MPLTQVQGGMSAALVSGTAVASTSGTSIDFTGIPSWVKRITVMFNGVSTNGVSQVQVQIGISTGIETTGYIAGSAFTTATGGSTTGYNIYILNSGEARYGNMIICNMGSNSWASSHSMSNGTGACCGGGTKTLGGTLDRIRITTVNGTDTFDAGSINILYE